MSELLRLGRLYFVLLAIFAVGRWLLGTSGVPYEKAHQVFSIVILTLLSAIYYGAFCRAWLGVRVMRAVAIGALFGLASQVVILLATVASYALGLDTYFNHPTALQAEAKLAFGAADGQRLGGLVGNTLFTGIAGALGWSFGGLLPRERPPSA
jgi:hypothetical protein